MDALLKRQLAEHPRPGQDRVSTFIRCILWSWFGLGRGRWARVLLVGLSLFFLSSELAAAAEYPKTLHVNMKFTDAFGTVEADTWNLTFIVSSNIGCGAVLYSQSGSYASNAQGEVSVYLNGVTIGAANWNQQLYMCVYRNGSLEDSTVMGRVPMAFYSEWVNASGVVNNSDLNLSRANITAGNLWIDRIWLNGTRLNLTAAASGNYLPNDSNATTTYDVNTSGLVTEQSTYESHFGLRQRVNVRETSAAFVATTLYGRYLDFDYLADGTGFYTPTLIGDYMDMSFGKHAATFLSPASAQLVKWSITNDENVSYIAAEGSLPVDIAIADLRGGGLGSNGYMDVRASSNYTSSNIAFRSKMSVSGNGDAFGYQGYGTATGTGRSVGVWGYTIPNTKNGRAIGVMADADFTGSGPGLDSEWAFYSNTGHSVQAGSLYIALVGATGAGLKANSSTRPTIDHLGPNATVGEFYVQRGAEFDGKVWMDKARLILPLNTTDPGSPETGEVYFNTGNNTLMLYNGSAWRTVATS